MSWLSVRKVSCVLKADISLIRLLEISISRHILRTGGRYSCNRFYACSHAPLLSNLEVSPRLFYRSSHGSKDHWSTRNDLTCRAS